MLAVRDALDCDRGLTILAEAELPLNDSEYNLIFFAQIDDLIEALRVKEVACQLQRKRLSAYAASIRVFLFCCTLVQRP